jgi:iron complex outermembrane recepter protein
MWIAGDRTRSSSAFLGVSNLLDRDYNASVVINAAGRRFFEPAPGRRIYAGIDVHAPLIR